MAGNKVPKDCSFSAALALWLLNQGPLARLGDIRLRWGIFTPYHALLQSPVMQELLVWFPRPCSPRGLCKPQSVLPFPKLLPALASLKVSHFHLPMWAVPLLQPLLRQSCVCRLLPSSSLLLLCAAFLFCWASSLPTSGLSLYPTLSLPVLWSRSVRVSDIKAKPCEGGAEHCGIAKHQQEHEPVIFSTDNCRGAQCCETCGTFPISPCQHSGFSGNLGCPRPCYLPCSRGSGRTMLQAVGLAGGKGACPASACLAKRQQHTQADVSPRQPHRQSMALSLVPPCNHD